MNSLVKIVVTGGPCSGKTTALSVIQEKLTQLGYSVIVVPETATELIRGRISPNTLDSNFDFQRAIVKLQLAKEKFYVEAASKLKKNDKIVVVFDRALIDSKAYLTQSEFNELLEENGLNEIQVRDSYDAVFQLISAANGAEEYFLTTNNSNTEALEDARKIDRRISEAWTGHSHFRIIDNSTGFDLKLRRLVQEIVSFLGEPISFEIERKFLIEYPDIDAITKNYPCTKSEIIQTYLNSNDGSEVRVRQRGLNNYYTFTKTIKKNVDNIKRIEIESKISKDEYLKLLMDADNSKRQIRKNRYCFVYDSTYFELDIYPFWTDKAILEVELVDEKTEIKFPNEIKIIKEVTDCNEYKNSSLADIKNKLI